MELHLHGSRAIIEAVGEALISLGMRPAEPGEFTKRAFLNGKLDLLQAEAVHDLVSAETESQRRQALRQLEGTLGTIYRDWADRLRLVLAQQEALIDFPDEDLPPQIEAEMLATMATLRIEIHAHLEDRHRGEKLREGLFFAIIGPPNVGKSSLMNVLADRDVSIVSATPGTTRDALEARVILGGVPVTLVDTAGLRQTEDSIEVEGVRRSLARAAEADLVVEVVEAGSIQPSNGTADAARIVVANKADLGGNGPAGALLVSALTGEGIDALHTLLSDRARSLTQEAGPPPLTRVRHRLALQTARHHLHAAETADLPELRGEDLRLALRALWFDHGTDWGRGYPGYAVRTLLYRQMKIGCGG